MNTSLLNRHQHYICEIGAGQLGVTPLESLLDREYLLTNKRGGYSSSTVIGCNTRRYHGLLVGSLDPPANRIVGLNTLGETLLLDGERHEINTFEFPEKVCPEGFRNQRGFRRGLGSHFDYEVNGIEFTKSIYLMRYEDVVLIEYDFTKVDRRFEFIIRPFASLRDFHSLQKADAALCSMELGEDVFICHDAPGSCELLLNCPMAGYEKDEQWWFNFQYRKDQSRGQDFLEDLWSPGFYRYCVDSPGKLILKAAVGTKCDGQKLNSIQLDDVIMELEAAEKNLLAAAKVRDDVMRTLVLAADQFVCQRESGDDGRVTLLAGYHWFFDWGRDAFIALPGILLATGRFEQAKSVLTTFAAVADEGMIPNRFDDRSHTAYFNSIDASMWFINAAFAYLNTTNDGATFSDKLLPVIHWIVSAYQKGTRFDIHADEDGLITGGNEETQLTWMDAKFGGVAFTPRYGKAVELNALWYSGLCNLAKYYSTWDFEQAKKFDEMAEKVGESFKRVFWNERTGYLNDCVHPDGEVDTSCRCNQIIAVSLEFSALDKTQQRFIVDVIRRELLTPYGLRTLSPKDKNYKGRYEGGQHERDEAYHQGTVWPYFIGYFVEAYLKVNDFSSESRIEAQEFIDPLIYHLTASGNIGSICEIFDGDAPQNPRGCYSQAWSVGEVIRAIRLIHS